MLNFDMISLSKKYFLSKFENSNINYLCDNIRNINIKEKYDVCYSIGILEHYNDDEIIELINKQTSISEYVIFGIPTKYFDEDKKMYGNERYLSLHYWRKIIKKSNCKIIKESSYHYLSFSKKIINYKKWFKPNPVHIFVIKKNKIRLKKLHKKLCLFLKGKKRTPNSTYFLFPKIPKHFFH